MAALTITVANISRVAGTPQIGEALATITAGQALYHDGTTNSIGQKKVGLYDADHATAVNRTLEGVSLHGALSGQPIAYLGNDGDVMGFGAILTVNTIYIGGATAGNIHPIADIASTWYLGMLGHATTTSQLTFKKINSGVATA